MTSEDLNIKVAELKGWSRWDVCSPIDRKTPIILWQRGNLGAETRCELPAYVSDLNAAFSLLEGLNFMVFTCDMGYSCKIYTAPEHGEEELAEGFADTVPVAICRAFVQLKGVEV